MFDPEQSSFTQPALHDCQFNKSHPWLRKKGSIWLLVFVQRHNGHVLRKSAGISGSLSSVLKVLAHCLRRGGAGLTGCICHQEAEGAGLNSCICDQGAPDSPETLGAAQGPDTPHSGC